jgi:hypothetical protein
MLHVGFCQAGVDLDEPMGVHASSAEAEALPFAQRRGYLLLQRTEAIMAGSLRGVALRRQVCSGSRPLELVHMCCGTAHVLRHATRDTCAATNPSLRRVYHSPTCLTSL